MKVGNTHLTYCLNVHPGESWQSQYDAIKKSATNIKNATQPDQPFGLGLRLSAEAAETIDLPQLKELLDEHNMYVFTINGFPYGNFHKGRVKENVYQPDWQDSRRVVYTLRLADILAELLPDNVDGSISTVSLGYRYGKPVDIEQCVEHLTLVAEHLDAIQQQAGKTIRLALEPEPDCILQKTEDCISFFLGKVDKHPKRNILKRHTGICFDTCHFAVGFEPITESLKQLIENGISIAKIQLSAALRLKTSPSNSSLDTWSDPVYLHQTRVRSSNGAISSYVDLPDALQNHNRSGNSEWRIHFHVPLYFSAHDGITSTNDELTSSFFKTVHDANIQQLEIETYTFDVLPSSLKNISLEESICKEYRWVLERMYS